MKKNSQLFIKKSEIKIIVGILAVVAILGVWSWRNRKPGKQAQVYRDGVLVEVIDLNQDGYYPRESITMEVKDHSIKVTDSICPDKICVKTGSISYVGQIIACVPQNLVIVISGESDIDAVAGR